MKTIKILPVLVLSAGLLHAQNSTEGVVMGQEFTELAKGQSDVIHGISPSAFQSYSSNQVIGSQFFFPSWHAGEIITNRKEVYNAGLEFMYDKVRQQVFVRQKDSTFIILTNKDEVQSFSLRDENNKKYFFVNTKQFSDARPELYYQILVYDSFKISLLKYIKTSFVKADPNDMLKQKEGEIYDAFVDKEIYYIMNKNRDPLAIQLKSKNLKKVFAELNIPIDKYLDAHPQPVDEEYLIDMVKSLNSN